MNPTLQYLTTLPLKVEMERRYYDCRSLSGFKLVVVESNLHGVIMDLSIAAKVNCLPILSLNTHLTWHPTSCHCNYLNH